MHTPLDYEAAQANRIKLLFLTNLIAGLEFSDEQVSNARDALEQLPSRALINYLLHLPESERQGLAGEFDKTVMPLALLADDRRDITRRVVAFLRPDPKMVVEIEKKIVNTEPPVHVYQVVIEDGRGGSWCEAFTTELELNAFLKGIKVTFAMSDLQRLLPEFGAEAPLVFVEQSSTR